MKTFHVDEPREIGKKRIRVTAKELSMAKNELKEKLGRVGLSFDCQIEGDKGSKTVDVKQFGGRFGKDTDGSDINDDGISHKKEGGLKMEVSYETLKNGTSKVYAKLV